MGLDLWFPSDVARILASTQEAMSATMSASPALDQAQAQAQAYRQGFLAAIGALAVAFGVADPDSPGSQGNRFAQSVQVIEAKPDPVRGW